jgi:hypothetical protein
MQQLKIAERPQQRDAELAGTFMQRLVGLGAQRTDQKPSNADLFDNRELDQRVRESGEW